MAGKPLVPQVAVSKMLIRPKQTFRRFTLCCLYVDSQTITVGRKQITLPSMEDQLQEFFSKILISLET
ncbi:MAG TPA: hypothetical protein DGB85_01875 [Deltaproteobacteria bacterium]|nr:hypothetical protein [Deltaproteobacteria bacterium]